MLDHIGHDSVRTSRGDGIDMLDFGSGFSRYAKTFAATGVRYFGQIDGREKGWWKSRPRGFLFLICMTRVNGLQSRGSVK